MNKSHSINIPLTDEMKQFIASQSGSGTLYSTPSEYVRDLIRHDRERQEAGLQLLRVIRTLFTDGLESSQVTCTRI